MPTTLTALLTLSLALVPPLGGSADTRSNTQPEGPPAVEVFDKQHIGVRDQEVGGEGQAKSPAGRRRVTSGSPKPTYVYWTLDWFDGDSFCLRRTTTTNEAKARVAPSGKWLQSFAEANDGVKAECPAPAAAPRHPAVETDRLVRSFLDVRRLPTPQLRTVPDYAITGKKVYLEILGPREVDFQVDNPIGDDVGIDASSFYEVDWGDGERTTTRSQGGPWPEGDVTHTYIHAVPKVTITVTQVWSATWQAGPLRGGVDPDEGLRTAGSLDLPVTQVQAVRNR